VDLHDRIRTWWDQDAPWYDRSAGHAMSDPVEAAAWRAVLAAVLPPAPARVLDVGAGTGSLALIAAELGHEVTALDLSDAMLERGRAKAAERGLDVTFVVGRAEEPPDGPFDEVMSRHLVWTLPEPVEALVAWRRAVRPGGGLAIFEGSWAGEGPVVAVKDAVARAIQRAVGTEDGHHAPYPREIRERLPLGRPTTPRPFLDAVTEAGWTRPRLVRLRDVEWTIERREPWPLGWLRHRSRYAIVGDA
jgi:ubiquinone/menaquinone biosynthesis C-methylase UbiE